MCLTILVYVPGIVVRVLYATNVRARRGDHLLRRRQGQRPGILFSYNFHISIHIIVI